MDFFNEKIFGNYSQITIEYQLSYLKISRVGKISNLILRHPEYIDIYIDIFIPDIIKTSRTGRKSSLFLKILKVC